MAALSSYDAKSMQEQSSDGLHGVKLLPIAFLYIQLCHLYSFIREPKLGSYMLHIVKDEVLPRLITFLVTSTISVITEMRRD
jgi:hypothetical protein